MEITNYSQFFAALMHCFRDDGSLIDVLESGINGRSTCDQMGQRKPETTKDEGNKMVHVRRLIIAE